MNGHHAYEACKTFASWRSAFRRASVLSVPAFVVLFLLTGCGFAGANEQSRLVVGYIAWDENVANSNLVKILAEDELGYDEVQLVRHDNPRPVIEAVAEGDTDAFLDVWMPAHQQFIDYAENEGGRLRLSRSPWYTDRTRFGIAVPDYMEDVRSIEDLDDSGAAMITGIEPGALLMQRIGARVIPEYDLDLALVESSTPAMLSELDRAYAGEEPFVFLAWSPHWMNEVYDFHYLDDPKGTMKGIVDPSRLHSVYRDGLKRDDPVGYALLDSMRLSEDQLSALQLEIGEVGDPEQGTRNWLRDNREVVEPWLEAATAAGGLG